MKAIKGLSTSGGKRKDLRDSHAASTTNKVRNGDCVQLGPHYNCFYSGQLHQSSVFQLGPASCVADPVDRYLIELQL